MDKKNGSSLKKEEPSLRIKRILLIFLLVLFVLQTSYRALQITKRARSVSSSSLTLFFEEPWKSDPQLGWIVHDPMKEKGLLGYIADETDPEAERSGWKGLNRCRIYAVPTLLRANITSGLFIINCSDDTQATRRLKEMNAEWLLKKSPGIGWAITKELQK